MGMTLPERFADTRSNLAQEQAQFVKRLRSRGIDPKFIFVAERDAHAETIESAWAGHDPPHTVIFTDDPDYLGVRVAQLEYERAKQDLREASPGQIERYKAWEAKWHKHFVSTYGYSRHFDFSIPADVQAAEQHQSDLQKMNDERALLLKEMIVQPVDVPEGWEGNRPESPIISLDDVEQLARDALSKLRRWHDIGWMGGIYLESAAHSLRNAHRCLEWLHIAPRPEVHAVKQEFISIEVALANLVSWIESRLAEERRAEGKSGQGNGALLQGDLEKSATSAGPKARPSRAEYNVRARDYLRQYPQASARDLQKYLGCGMGTVYKLDAFIAVRGEHKKGRKPKAVSLTKGMESAARKDDGELARLVGEQRKDQRSDTVGARERL
jgi:hypothetical protein